MPEPAPNLNQFVVVIKVVDLTILSPRFKIILTGVNISKNNFLYAFSVA